MRTFEQQLKGFLENADVSDKSKKLYRIAVRQFSKWVVKSGRNIHQLHRADILQYKADLEKSGKAEATMDIYLLAVRLFFKYLSYCGESDNVAEGIRCKRTRKSYGKEHLTDEECIRLLGSIDRTTEAGARDFAIIYLMISTGLRCVEVSRLLVGDMHARAAKPYLVIQRKREIRKQCEFGVPREALQPILDYLKFRKNPSADEPLFKTEYNNPMSPRRVGLAVKSHLVASGVYSETKTTHSLRHTAAVRALKAGRSVYDVKILLGHSDIKTTQRYLASAEDERQLDNPAICLLDLNVLNGKETGK